MRRAIAGVAGVGLVLCVLSGGALAQDQHGTIVGWGAPGAYPNPIQGFTKIAAGGYHSLGLKSNGSVMGWGADSWGQCDPPAPNTGFVAISGRDATNIDGGHGGAFGGHSLGLKADGSIVAWGSDGLDTQNWQGVWVHVDLGILDLPSPNTGFVAIAAGGLHSLGLKADGSVVAWGSTTQVPPPNTGFVAVSAGNLHSLGLKADGSIVAWGSNDYMGYHAGQCDVPAPNSDFVGVAAGTCHSLGLKADGSIVAWGYNYNGQCDVPSPNTGFVAVAAGRTHSLGLKADGSIVAWGDNHWGQCDVPAPNTNFVAIAAGDTWSLGLIGYALGDLNRDGAVNHSDIDPFVLALIDPQACAEQYPHCDILNADINLDGVVNAFDIDPFVDLLIGG